MIDTHILRAKNTIFSAKCPANAPLDIKIFINCLFYINIMHNLHVISYQVLSFLLVCCTLFLLRNIRGV